tara:strand:+ start:322 stop:618 length:297 start_codon:yes stop_codon:yes gene_type:complete
MNKKYYLREEGNQIFMCCGKAKCPSVALQGEEIIIRDDHGNVAHMKVEEALLLSEAAKKISEEPLGGIVEEELNKDYESPINPEDNTFIPDTEESEEQ